MDFLIKRMRRGLVLGQSVHHVFATEDMPCSERTFYRYVENEDVPILSIELAKKVKYKKRHHAKRLSHKSGYYAGHEYEDYLALCEQDRSVTTEVDTFWGKASDHKCILTLHRIDLHFQIHLLLKERTKECVIMALDWLEMCCEGRFSEFFGLLLLDRGSEFDDIAGIERSCLGEGTRTAAYYTDSSRPDQKGHAEKNHVEIRKILPKGTTFEGLDAYVLAEISSHVNSSVRKGCGDTSPMQLAQLIMPKSLLDNLGLRLILPKDVIGAPGILYRP
jgi:IS30 family transposase